MATDTESRLRPAISGVGPSGGAAYIRGNPGSFGGHRNQSLIPERVSPVRPSWSGKHGSVAGTTSNPRERGRRSQPKRRAYSQGKGPAETQNLYAGHRAEGHKQR